MCCRGAVRVRLHVWLPEAQNLHFDVVEALPVLATAW
jgi:hypothetical protein